MKEKETEGERRHEGERDGRRTRNIEIDYRIRK